MPAFLRALILIALGALVLAVAYRGWKQGELPAGARGFSAYRPNRTDNPLAFHFHFIFYICGGVALTVWGLLALIGLAAPPALW